MKISTKNGCIDLLTSRLNNHATDTRRFHVLAERTIEKPFGWVFLYEVMTSGKGSCSSESTRIIRPAIVNKHSGQMIGNSTDQPVETIIKSYEELLAESKAIAEGWCLTFSPRKAKTSALKKLAEKAERAGFYEISNV